MSGEPTTGGQLRFVASLLRPQGRGFLLVGLLVVGVVAATIATPLLVGRAVDRIDAGDTQGIDGSFAAAVGIALAGVLAATFSAAATMVATRISLRIERDLRSRLYRHFQVVEPTVLDTRSTGDLVSLLSTDLIPISSFLGARLTAATQSILTLLLSAAIMLWLEPFLALLALVPLPLAVGVLARYHRRSVPILLAARRAMGRLSATVREAVEGVATVRAYAREDEQRERFGAATGQVLDRTLAVNRMTAIYGTTVDMLPLIGSAVVVIVGGRLAISGDLSVVDFAVFYTYLVMLVPSTRQLGLTLGQAQFALASVGRVMEALRHPVQPSPAEPPLPAVPAAIRMRGVRADAPGGDPILEGVDVDVPPGRTVAVLGTTGSGKSTLLALVNRLRDAREGRVEVGDAPVAEVDIHSLRRAIGTATDDNFLFSGTLAENIAFARPEATQEEVEAAARLAKAHDFIAALPDGYETVVGDRGAGLSGGQRQRIALARALLTRPPVLLLDNATGNLDALTETAVLDGLEQERREAPPTRLVVGYRPAVLRRADEVVVLDSGRVVERGTHEELLRRSARYRQLVGADDGETAGGEGVA